MNKEKIVKKVAVFEYAPGSCIAGFRTVNECAHEETIRISEWETIEFTPFPYDEVVPEMVAAIEKQIEKITEKALEEVNELKVKRAELLAIG